MTLPLLLVMALQLEPAAVDFVPSEMGVLGVEAAVDVAPDATDLPGEGCDRLEEIREGVLVVSP